jgi:uncharacterized protein
MKAMSSAKRCVALALLAAFANGPAVAADPCKAGVYGRDGSSFVVIGPKLSATTPGQRYLFLDGRRGRTGDTDAAVNCDNDIAVVRSSNGQSESWPRRATTETDVTFESVATKLEGRLIEPAGAVEPDRPLVVMVHGSEKTPALQNIYAYMLAAQGIAVFVYDKRGTGSSAGEYTQNFELLADDASAALAKARTVAAGRFGRAGFFGGSQGGWVAPLAATRSSADFVAVGFGLVVSPVEEDREQLLEESRRMGLDAKSLRQVERLSDATATLVRSHFTRGFGGIASIRQSTGSAAWASTIEGEYSGDMLRMTDADLRRIGRARFDNLELIWDYDAREALAQLQVPLFWVLAAEDREAPIQTTRAILLDRKAAGQTIDAYLFPDTDHGMTEYHVNPDGTRSATRITDGYLRLLADWIKRDLNGSYGRASKL